MRRLATAVASRALSKDPPQFALKIEEQRYRCSSLCAFLPLFVASAGAYNSKMVFRRPYTLVAVICVALLLSACVTQPRTHETYGQRELLITMYEDTAGHVLKTRQLEVYADGHILEETYMWLTTPPTHTVRALPQLPENDVRSIRAAVDEAQLCKLPERIPSARSWVVMDAPFRAISFDGEHSRCRVTWDAPFDNWGDETERFDRLWERVLNIVERTGA